MHKLVNGIKVDLTEEEIAEFNQREQDHIAFQKASDPFLYIGKRNILYNQRGCTDSALITALWERIVENRPESSDTLQAIREQVKQEIPKYIQDEGE